MAKVTGILKVYVNGKKFRVKPGAKLKTGGYKRTAVTGDSVYGYTEEVEASELDCTVIHTADTNVQDLNDAVDSTLRVETDTGKVYTVARAFTTEPCEIQSGGDLPLKMAGEPAIEE